MTSQISCQLSADGDTIAGTRICTEAGAAERSFHPLWGHRGRRLLQRLEQPGTYFLFTEVILFFFFAFKISNISNIQISIGNSETPYPLPGINNLLTFLFCGPRNGAQGLEHAGQALAKFPRLVSSS